MTTILHILDHSVPLFSGYSFRSRSIVNFQRRLGLRPVVLTSPKHGSRREGVDTIEGVSYHRTPTIMSRVPLVRECRQMLRLAARIMAVARAEKADILHAHSPVLNGLPALWAGRRLGLPVVYEARAFWEDAAVDHGTVRAGSLRYWLSRTLESLVFRQAGRVVVIANAMCGDILQRGVPANRIVTVPNGVDTDHFKPCPRDHTLARELGLDSAPVLGFIGSFYRYEGLRFLVEALPALRDRLDGARVLLVGAGEEEDALRRLSGVLDGSVVLPGQIPHGEIRRYYSLIDMFVCPRRRMRLTELVTPLKPLEAMAMERAVLASDVGGQAELIQDGVTGMLFAAESKEMFLRAAEGLGRSPETRARLGKNAREYVVEERGWARVVSRYVPIYQSLLETR